jgi:hypothetical protein
MKGTDIATARSTPPEPIRFRLDRASVHLDPRTHAVRGDLADIALAGTLFSAHYARPLEMSCVAAGAMLRATPSVGATAISQILRGEAFQALDVTTEWVWGYSAHDGYVGYVRREALDRAELPQWRVAGSAPVFSAPDIKAPVVDIWPMGARCAGAEDGVFVTCVEGYVHMRHLVPIAALEQDWVAVGLRYLGQPYVWGGRGHGGLDCSGLVQVALGACGIPAPRDTDLQREALGKPLAEDAALKRGDLVFFPGHVGMMVDEARLLHANAHWMATVVEPLADVVERLRPRHETPVTARRRIG